MSEQLSTALVTGGSRGIGKAIAETLAKAGYQVYLTYVSKADEAEAVARNIVAAGGKACAFRLDVAEELAGQYGAETMAVQCDVSQEEQVNTAVQKVLERFGTVDVLVNNAGITKDGLMLRMKDEDFDRVIQTNLRGAFVCVREAAKIMTRQRHGRIINISSVVGQMGNLAASPIYAASKAAVWCMTKSLAGEMGPYQVTVNAVAPGYIMTEMTRNAGYLDDMVPMKRLGTPEDVADVVGFLASEDSRYVTGMIVDINGGTVMR